MAVATMFFALAWPMHLAGHAAGPVAARLATATVPEADDAAREGASPDQEREEGARACAWCALFAAQPGASSGDPGPLALPAPAGPGGAPCDQEMHGGAEDIAAAPRGPPGPG